MLVKEKRGQAESTYWIQEEPVLWGTKLDLPSWAGELMASKMVTARVATLGQVVALTDPQMDDPSGLAAQLGLCSKRTVQKLLDHWKTKLSCHDRLLLTSPITTMVKEEPFPAIFLALDFKDCSGCIWKDAVYKMLVKTMNRHRLNLWPSSRLQAPLEGAVQASNL
ncbi:hypothetical protein D4764_16G0001350 [Takifugu flavidus]|uniref:Uncharacterized protein n=1 Tax=Takifugu flavidus TaxID=433684 RepID=A0A5C6NXT3_9TELE|nr:hypothetical protein D4764_16G0001350 [Takifugu flavidus]